jgi:hypothetical protein
MGADIIRIEDCLGLDFWEFGCRWADPDGRIARNTAPHVYFEDEPQTPFVICLKHEPSAIHPETTACRFLVECEPDDAQPLGTSRCGIYATRPAACRCFPGKLSDSRELVVLSDLSQISPRGENPIYELCPRPWSPDDVDSIQLTQDLVVLQHELDFFRRVATFWNAAPRAWELFPEFLRSVYRRRVAAERPQDGDHDVATIPFPQTAQVDALAA